MSIAVSVHGEQITAEMYDAVSGKLGEEPPEGMLVQAAGAIEAGGFRIFNIWESTEHYERFREQTLLPAIREVAGEEAFAGMPTAEVYELHDLYVRPPS